MVLDPSAPRQSYVEDCEACCQPIQIHYAIEGGNIVEFEAAALN